MAKNVFESILTTKFYIWKQKCDSVNYMGDIKNSKLIIAVRNFANMGFPQLIMGYKL